MQSNSILDFIGECLNDTLREMLGNGKVMKINLDENENKLEMAVRFDLYIEDKFILEAQSAVKSVMGLGKVIINAVYPSSAYGEKCRDMLIRALKENIAAANGFLENAEFVFENEKLSINVFDPSIKSKK